MAAPNRPRKESPPGQGPCRGSRHAQLGRRGAPGTRVSQREASEAAPGFGAGASGLYSRLAVADGLLAFTIIAVLAAGAGITDKLGDSLVLLAVALSPARSPSPRRTFVRRERPPTARVIAGLASTWASLVLAGSIVYLASGTITTVDEASLNPLPDSARSPRPPSTPNRSAPRCRSSEPEPSSSAASSASSPVWWHCLAQ